MTWLALHLPALSLQCRERGVVAAPPLAISDGGRLVACNAAARRLGVRAGLADSAARALAPGLRILPRNPSAEQAALARLATWAMRFSDQVSLAPPAALVLEAGRSLLLFGGAAALHRQAAEGAAALGWRVRCVLAPTAAGALLAAAGGRDGLIADRAALRQALAELPTALLDFTPAELEDLARMGLGRIGDLLRLPRAGLAERFGIERVYQLDRLLGDRPDPRRPFVPPARFRAELELPAEVEDAAALLFACRRLVDELCAGLLARQGGVQQLGWRLIHAEHAPTRFRLGTVQPERDPARWLGLLRERLERLPLPAPVRAIALASEAIRPLATRPGELFPDDPAAPVPDPTLLDRLRARLGEDAVRGLMPRLDHRPEHAWRWCVPGEHGECPGRADRPLWLLPAPVPLALRDRRPWLDGPLTLGSGCERIDTGWWDGQPIARDYYVATTPSGERLWIYRDIHGERGWWLHGVLG